MTSASALMPITDDLDRELSARSIHYNREQLDLIKDTYAKGATDQEFSLFIEVARRKGLDIFSGQICLIGRWDQQLQREVRRPQTTIDGLRLIAERTGGYCPGQHPMYSFTADGQPISATAYVKKWVGGSWHEISATAFFDEFAQKKKSGDLTAMWAKMPRLMLAKCAEALALRRAFPADCSGIYTEEEMGQASNPPAVEAQPGEVIDAEPVELGDPFEQAVPDDSGWKVPKVTKMKILDMCAALEELGVTEAMWRRSIEVYAGPGKTSRKDLTPDSAARFLAAASQKLKALRSQ